MAGSPVHRSIHVLAAGVVAAWTIGFPAAASAAPDPDPPAQSAILGAVVDAQTGDPLAAAHVRLRETGRSELSHADGSFHLRNLAAGRYTVSVQRLGYRPAEQEVRVGTADTVRITVELNPSALDIAGIVVTGTTRERGAHEAYQPTSVLSDAELRRRLAPTVTATIAREPGIHEQYNGPAANRPIIRGMGGDRILVLEDGQRTGDLYATAADHAVVVEPITAERIEVVRGPAGLIYGSNALGGVVNVVREEVPRSVPERLEGTASVQGESVNRGLAGGASVHVPAGRVVVRAEAAARGAGDTRTPLGVLPSSDLRGVSAGLGASVVGSWGYVGIAGREQRFDYGIPGEFRGQRIPGAHEGGVDIETVRRTGRLEAAHLAGLGPFNALELDGHVVHYLHDEIELLREDGSPVFGGRFDQLSGGGELIARHRHESGTLRIEGAMGLVYRGKDLLAARGAGTRSAAEDALAGFIYEEFGLGAVRLQAGGRYDRVSISPYDTSPIQTGTGASEVRDRRFGAFSGSVAVLGDVADGITIGASVSRAFRAPAIPELFSDGPHLADFSFNIGNPELDPEIGHGVDAFVRASGAGFHGEIAAYRNRVSSFIHYVATGELDPRFGRYPVFEARGDDALFTGVEGRVQWEPVRAWVVDGTGSLVRASRRPSADPLPDIPPATAAVEVRHDRERWFAAAGWRGAAAQTRVPAPVEVPGVDGDPIVLQGPTDGYGLFDLSGGLRLTGGRGFHTITLNVRNVTDAVWRDHLSRIKEVAPQPGRNVQLLYRVNF